MFIERICGRCNKLFLAYDYNVNRGYGLFCSRSCSGKRASKRNLSVELICAFCSKHFMLKPSSAKYRKTCSISCKANLQSGKPGYFAGKKRLDMRGKNHPHWLGGLSFRECAGRMIQYLNGRTDKRYRFVAEEALGRKLLNKSVIHHIDEDTMNDEPENLFLFRHKAAHMRWHLFLRRHELDGKFLESNLVLSTNSITI